MRHLARRLAVPTALVAMIGLSGCVGAPAPGPVAYTPGYAPPPSVYVPPNPNPGYAPPAPPAQQVAYSGTCYAGVYTCQLPQQLPLGAPCSCPGIGAPSYGNVR